MHPSRSRALLVGAGRFGASAGLDDLPSVRPGVEELQRLLLSPDGGGLDSSACHVLLDPATVNEVDDELMRSAEDAEDTLLVYYAGHGVPLPRDGSLHLALGNTDRKRLHATAYPIDWVKTALLESNATSRVVIVDCCFSGRAIQTMSGDGIAEQVDTAGSFVMTAAPANKPAAAPEGEQYTAFTGALIRVLKEGVPDGREHLDLDTIYRSVKADLRRRGLPQPQSQRMNEAARLALARNPAAKRARRETHAQTEVRTVVRTEGPETAVDRAGSIVSFAEPLRLRPAGSLRSAARRRHRTSGTASAVFEMHLAGDDTCRARVTVPGESPLEALERLEVRSRQTIELLVRMLRDAAERPRSEREEPQPYLDALSGVGRELYDLLFQGELREMLAESINALRSDRLDLLRVRLMFEPPARWLAALPWEALYASGSDPREMSSEFLVEIPGVTLTRATEQSLPLLSALSPPVRVLLVAPTPRDLVAVDEAPTIKALESCPPSDLRLELLRDNDSFAAAALTALRLGLTETLADIVHYVGHVRIIDGESQLAFTGIDGSVEWVRAQDFAEVVTRTTTVRLVVLEGGGDGALTAYVGLSGVTSTLAATGPIATVGVPLGPTPRSAGAFTSALYGALLDSQPLDVAVAHARESMSSTDDAAPLMPATYLSSPGKVIERQGPGVPFPSASQVAGGRLANGSRRCPRCNSRVSDSDRFCATCAEEL